MEKKGALTCLFHAFPANLLASAARLLRLEVIAFGVLSGTKGSVLLVYLVLSSGSYLEFHPFRICIQ